MKSSLTGDFPTKRDSFSRFHIRCKLLKREQNQDFGDVLSVKSKSCTGLEPEHYDTVRSHFINKTWFETSHCRCDRNDFPWVCNRICIFGVSGQSDRAASGTE